MNYALKLIEKFYLSVVNDKILLKSYLDKKELAPLRVEIQEIILNITIHSQYCKKYSPPLSYQKFFLRTILDSVEENECELSENLIETYANVLSTSSNMDSFYRTYIINDDCVVTLQESSCFVANSTTGLQTWEASKYLLEWCIENLSIFKNRKILELGSGIGLLGISIIKLCPLQKYLFTDKSVDVLNILSKNIEINLDQGTVKAIVQKHQLLWGAVSQDDCVKIAADFILGADIVFDPTAIQDLVKTLKMFLVYGSTRCAFIASAIRNADTNECFIAQLDAAGLAYEYLHLQQKCIFIYNESSKFILYRVFCKQ